VSRLSKRRFLLDDAARHAFELKRAAEERSRRVLSTIDLGSVKGFERARLAQDELAHAADRALRARRLLEKVLTDERSSDRVDGARGGDA
jgi:hypothetical protein